MLYRGIFYLRKQQMNSTSNIEICTLPSGNVNEQNKNKTYNGACVEHVPTDQRKPPILRSINNAVVYMKTLDPDCQVTARMIRSAIEDGNIKARKVGKRKFLIDVNAIISYFCCENCVENESNIILEAST